MECSLKFRSNSSSSRKHGGPAQGTTIAGLEGVHDVGDVAVLREDLAPGQDALLRRRVAVDVRMPVGAGELHQQAVDVEVRGDPGEVDLGDLQVVEIEDRLGRRLDDEGAVVPDGDGLEHRRHGEVRPQLERLTVLDRDHPVRQLPPKGVDEVRVAVARDHDDGGRLTASGGSRDRSGPRDRGR